MLFDLLKRRYACLLVSGMFYAALPGAALASDGDVDLEIGSFSDSCSEYELDEGRYTYTFVSSCSFGGNVQVYGSDDYHYTGTLTCRGKLDGSNSLSGYDNTTYDRVEVALDFSGSLSKYISFDFDDLSYDEFGLEKECAVDLTATDLVAQAEQEAEIARMEAEQVRLDAQYEQAATEAADINAQLNASMEYEEEYGDADDDFDAEMAEWKREQADEFADMWLGNSDFGDEDVSESSSARNEPADIDPVTGIPAIGHWWVDGNTIRSSYALEDGEWSSSCETEYLFFETCKHMVYRGYYRVPPDMAKAAGVPVGQAYAASFWMGSTWGGEGPLGISINLELAGMVVADSSFSLGYVPTVGFLVGEAGSEVIAAADCNAAFGPDRNFPNGGLSCAIVENTLADMETLARQISDSIQRNQNGLVLFMVAQDGSGMTMLDYIYVPAAGFDEQFERTLADSVPEEVASR